MDEVDYYAKYHTTIYHIKIREIYVKDEIFTFINNIKTQSSIHIAINRQVTRMDSLISDKINHGIVQIQPRETKKVKSRSRQK